MAVTVIRSKAGTLTTAAILSTAAVLSTTVIINGKKYLVEK